MKRKPSSITLVIIVIPGLLSALGGTLGSFATSTPLPKEITPLLRFSWPAFGIVTFLGIALAVWQARHQDETNEPSVPQLSNQNRQRLLAKVRTFWITGVLDKSLHGAALIALGLRKQPDALADPWKLVLQKPDQSTRSLPSGTRITHVYDEAIGELLILGEPGAGKSTLLLELARDLLDRAEKDESHPIPLVFNLSSWAVKQQPLAGWLVEEMNTKYQIPRPLGQAWVAADQVLPLLDGLDEVGTSYRPACAGAINTFRLQHGLVPTVVCCRSADYLGLNTRLLLRYAVTVQPLTPTQIDDYLSSAGGQLEAVRVALREDQTLQELATTPLMLSVLTLAYYGKPVEDLLAEGSLEIRRRNVFETYVVRMLQRRGANLHYTKKQAMHWLVWMANQLKQRSQTDFYIEFMQPDWLSDKRTRKIYHIAVNLIIGVTSGLVLGVAAFINVGKMHEQINGQNTVLVGWLFFGLVGGLIGMLVGWFKKLPIEEIQLKEIITIVWKDLWNQLVRAYLLVLLLVLFIVQLFLISGYLYVGLSVGRIGDFQVGIAIGWFLGMIIGWFYAAGKLYLKREVSGDREENIKEVLSKTLQFEMVLQWLRKIFWNEVKSELLLTLNSLGIELNRNKSITSNQIERASLLKRLVGSLFGGLIGGLLGGLVSGLLGGWMGELLLMSVVDLILRMLLILIAAVLIGSLFGLFLGVQSGLIAGFSLKMQEKHKRTRPNQGIRLSVRNSISIGLFTWLFLWLIIWYLGNQFPWLVENRFIMQDAPPAPGMIGLFSGLVVGFLVLLSSGGLTFIRHYTLRILFWRSGYMPWKYSRFLDFAVECLLLRKVGGGYAFIHLLLQDYFASLDTKPASDDPTISPGAQESS